MSRGLASSSFEFAALDFVVVDKSVMLLATRSLCAMRNGEFLSPVRQVNMLDFEVASFEAHWYFAGL